MDKISVLILLAILAVGCDGQGYEDEFERLLPGCDLASEELQPSCNGTTLLWEGRDEDSSKVVFNGCIAEDCADRDCNRPSRCVIGMVRDKDGGDGTTWSVWAVSVEGREDIRPRSFEEWEREEEPLGQ